MMIQYHSVVLMCDDLEKSQAFYEELFGLTIELAIEGLVCFQGGISLWKRRIATDLVYGGAEPSGPAERPSQEIYFETDDIDGFFSKISKAGIPLLHPVQVTPWHQKTVRFFDPDRHLIEVGESMVEVIRRLGKNGSSPEKVAEMVMMPVEIIRSVLDTRMESRST